MLNDLSAVRWEKQLYVGGVGARALWAAIDRDTRFLADNHVMDYSLLLGLRGQHIELGIIGEEIYTDIHTSGHRSFIHEDDFVFLFDIFAIRRGFLSEKN